MKTLISDRRDTGVRTVMEETSDGLLLHTTQDAEPILALNHAKRSLGRQFYAADPDVHKVASIPIGVAMQWLTRYGIEAWNPDHMPGVRRLLNDGEWRYLKTAEVTI